MRSLPLIAIAGHPSYAGTWVHHLLALDLASWISVDFKLWANKTLWYVITGDYQALTPEAEEAQRRVQQIWDEIRAGTKVTRRLLTDAIKDWYIRNPGATSRPQHVMFAHVTNAIYQKLWGVNAEDLESYFGCPKTKSRDYLNAQDLKILEFAEFSVLDYIDEDNIKPIDAVQMANIRRKPFNS